MQDLTKRGLNHMTEKAGQFKAVITFPLSGNLQDPLPTTTQVQAAIIAGCVADGLPTPTTVTVT
jgi:hypothetical protein